MTLFSKTIFKYSLIAIISVEILSFLSFQYPVIAPWVFGAVVLVALVTTIKNLEWGICIVFAELVIGSFGKILVLPIHDFQLPIRMVLWGIVMAVWLVPAIKNRRIGFLGSQFFKPYIILAAVLAWGIIWGLARGNNLDTVFFDVNNYLYFALVFPVYEILSSGGNAINRVRTIIIAAITWLSIKTILLFYIFSHELFGLQDVLYAWSRQMQLAEITNISPLYITSRIFMQSQIWILFGLFVGLAYVFHVASPARRSGGTPGRGPLFRLITQYKGFLVGLGTTAILSTALIMSFSRSFWLATAVSLVLLGLVLWLALREKFWRVFTFGGISLGVMVLAVGLTIGVMSFPLPRGGTSSAGLLKERIEKFSSEPAASSRLSQIRPLLTGIAKHPAIGSGFGTAVTYQSQDPRIVKSHPDGWYTTTAFELGWLEMWLKIGLLGVGVYLYLLWRILKVGWQQIKFGSFGWDSGHSDRCIILGGLFGLVALVITHGVSPYLNHPLGIGIILLTTSFIDHDA